MNCPKCGNIMTVKWRRAGDHSRGQKYNRSPKAYEYGIDTDHMAFNRDDEHLDISCRCGFSDEIDCLDRSSQ